MGAFANVIKFIAVVAICEAAGVIGALFTTKSIPTWYQALIKPSFNPPNWIFGPVWTTLYFLMGVSLFLVWANKTTDKKLALIFFFAQLILNTLWSIIFFGMHAPFYAFIEIILMWGMILLSIIYSWKISAWAGALLIPYLLWVSFASVLNFYLWKLNS